MWKCIRCEKENQDSIENCVNCGHGRTMDYTGHRVLSKIRPEITDEWKQDEEQQFLRAINYLTIVYRLLNKSGMDESAKKIKEVLVDVLLEAYTGRCPSLMLKTDEEVRKALNEKPMLMSVSEDDRMSDSVLGSKFLKRDVCEIDFVKMSLDDIPSVAWDVSADKNGEIWAWMDETPDGYILNIGSENGVYANTNCRGVFDSYCNAKKIEFNNLFDTSCVRDMKTMFFACSNLKELDVSGFKTDKVKNFEDMFGACDKLERLDVSRFKTGCAENMTSMFLGCSSLTELDVSGFKTDKVRSMAGMFWYCIKLESLDVSKFETGSVENMARMFYGCHCLRELNVSEFDTKNVTDMTEMFWGCENLKELNISNFHFREDVKTARMFECSGVEKEFR